MKRSSKRLKDLLKLLDDDSPDVRASVRKELLAYGPGLKDELVDLISAGPPDETERLKKHFKEAKEHWIQKCSKTPSKRK